MAPAAGPGIIGLGQQVVDGIDPRRLQPAQGLTGKIAAGIQVGIAIIALRLVGTDDLARAMAMVNTESRFAFRTEADIIAYAQAAQDRASAAMPRRRLASVASTGAKDRATSKGNPPGRSRATASQR